ncbi:KRFB protein, partial [Neodrepanis coruscans]|nr:KRFB protein [Neodrepanis coruscans]
MSCEKNVCAEPCGQKCPEPRAAACNEPCVVACPDSRVIIFPPPVVVTFPGPILTTYPQETVVGSTESAELAAALESGVAVGSSQKGLECLESCCGGKFLGKCEAVCAPQ